jgi:hypothetical protein
MNIALKYTLTAIAATGLLLFLYRFNIPAGPASILCLIAGFIAAKIIR